MVSIELLWKKGPVLAASTSGGVLNVLLPGLPNPSSSGIFSPLSLAGWSGRFATPVLKLALPRLPPPKFSVAPAFTWHRLHLPSRLSRKISCPRFATAPLSGSGNARSCCRLRDSVNASSASSSSAVGSRESTPATRFNVLVKCWMTAPVAKDLRVPSPGAPSPDQPVRGPWLLLTEVRIASTCGTPRMTNLFSRSSKPSRFSRIRPNWRISFGFSKFFLSSALVSATNSGLSGGDKGRVEREIIFRRMACSAGPAVAAEGFVEEDLASPCNLVDRGRGRRLAGREDRQAGCERADHRRRRHAAPSRSPILRCHKSLHFARRLNDTWRR